MCDYFDQIINFKFQFMTQTIRDYKFDNRKDNIGEFCRYLISDRKLPSKYNFDSLEMYLFLRGENEHVVGLPVELEQFIKYLHELSWQETIDYDY
jgi:hypothetical protein